MSPDDAGKSPAKRRRIAIALVGTFVTYLIAATLILPRVVKSQLIGVIEAQTGVQPTVEDVSFDPFGWRLSLDRFSLPDPAGGTPLVAFKSLADDVGLLRLLTATVALDEIVLVDPRVSAVISEGGRPQLSRLCSGADCGTG